jgi:hypothetical protein
MSLVSHDGVHVPACPSLQDHIDAAVRETAGSFQTLGDFVIDVQRQWAEEQQIADAGDAAVVAHWRQVDADLMAAQGDDWMRVMSVTI